MKELIDVIAKISEVRTAVTRQEAIDLKLPNYISSKCTDKKGALVITVMHTEIEDWPIYLAVVFNIHNPSDNIQLDKFMEVADVYSCMTDKLKDCIIRILVEKTEAGYNLLAFGSSKVNRCYILNGDNRAYTFEMVKAKLM